MSYNNYLDADAAYGCVSDFKEPTCVVVKHTNPCGVASRQDMLEAYRLAVIADPISAFGGIVAFNRPVDEARERLLSPALARLVPRLPVPRARFGFHWSCLGPQTPSLQSGSNRPKEPKVDYAGARPHLRRSRASCASSGRPRMGRRACSTRSSSRPPTPPRASPRSRPVHYSSHPIVPDDPY